MSRKAHTPGRWLRARGASSAPTAAACSSTRSASCRCPRRASSCACCRRARSSAWATSRTRKVNVRIIAATNDDLRQRVKEGRFRSDLYYRLNAYQVNIPPLRERKEDISLLAKRFLEKYSAVHAKKLRGFTDKAKRALLTYPWPGNIRELQNMVERGVILAPSGTRIEVEHLFSALAEAQAREFGLDIHGSLGLHQGGSTAALCEAIFNGMMTLDQLEVMLIETAVDKARGNLSAAARMLGLTRPQLAYRLKRLHEADVPVNAPEGELSPAAKVGSP